MELSSRIINKLKALSVNNKFTIEIYSFLIQKVFDSFTINEKFDIKFDDLIFENNIEKIELKEAVFTLYTFISELGKHDIESNSVGIMLEDLGFDADKVKIFKDYYEKKVSLVRLYLSRLSSSLPHVVDVNWRLDYTIKESNIDKINAPNYIVELISENPHHETRKSINFSSNLEQLQDLVLKLKETTRTLERLSQV